MERLTTYIGIVSAVLFVFFISFLATFNGESMVQRPLSAPTQATSTLTIVPISVPPVLEQVFPSLPQQATTTSQPQKAKAPSEKQKILPPPGTPAPSSPIVVQVVPVQTQSQTTSSGQSDLDVAASKIRSALVNILCNAPAGSRIRSISGSGIIVSSSGFILTNAHVAQYFLLADKGVSCVIRTGGPATNTYTAALAFISSKWLQANSGVLTEQAPTGDGEHDFAVLGITGAVAGTSLPSTFSYVPLASTLPSANDAVVIGSYGAQFLQSSEVQSSLFPTIVFGSVKQVFTFDTNTVDVFSLGGTAAAQEGSSGGGVVDTSGELTGTITTSTVEGDTSARELNAITADYIERNYTSETGLNIAALLSQTPAQVTSAFQPQISALEAVITQGL